MPRADLFTQEDEAMKRSALFVVTLLAAVHAGQPIDAAAPNRQPGVITWVRPGRLMPAQRSGLARLLIEAVDGKPLQGVLVRDSHPRIEGCRWSETKRPQLRSSAGRIRGVSAVGCPGP